MVNDPNVVLNAPPTSLTADAIPVSNGAVPPSDIKQLSKLDASKLKFTPAESLKPLPSSGVGVPGQTKTDYMLTASFDPEVGWSAPHIQPYGPLSLDPMSSCFHYATSVFEGMKAYPGPDGKPRLFRPKDNMARLAKSVERVALPPFDQEELLKCIKKLVNVESRWVPNIPDYSLYIRPTVIGTRPALGVTASDHAMIYVIVTPWGPYFGPGASGLSLLAVESAIRSWPGGTGGHKLASNYSPGFGTQREAAKKGFDQVLWLLPVGEEKRMSEVGVMNFFVVLKREDGDLDLITPPLDGTILPGFTRSSCIDLAAAHPSEAVLPYVPSTQRIYVHERIITVSEMHSWNSRGILLESFGVGTAVVVAPISKIAFEGTEEDIALPKQEGAFGPVAKSVKERLIAIQEGRYEWKGWSVSCESSE